MHEESLWIATTRQPDYLSQNRNITVDVAIVGAGVTGIVAAYLLKTAGKTVALIDKSKILLGETGYTTAHLTQVLDVRYDEIVSRFGFKKALLVARSHEDAIDWVGFTAEYLGISCGFKRVPGFLYSEIGQKSDSLEKELKAAAKLGIKVKKTTDIPFPGPVKYALCFENQAHFHPREFLLALASKIPGEGSYLFTNTSATDFKDEEPCVVVTDRGKIMAKDVIIAAHVPICNRVLIHTKLAAYRTYVVAGKISEGQSFDCLLWDTEDPYHYIRSHNTPDGDYLIIGGEDHKTGKVENTEKCFAKLEKYAHRFPIEEISYRWSGQIIEPIDGLAYIGKNPFSSHLYVATGYSGNGMTYGTLSGLILSDLIMGRGNRYEDLYAPNRLKGNILEYLSENKDYPVHLISDRLKGVATTISSVRAGEGKVIEAENEKVACYRDEKGQAHTFSAVCPHLGCLVHFNSSEKTWDCPCHGSRFSFEGEVINGPALSGLKPVELKQPRRKSAEKKRRTA